MTHFWVPENGYSNIRISCLSDVCLELAILETHWKVSFPVPISLFLFLILTKPEGDFKRAAKLNMAIQYSWAFVLETHISNAKLAAGL